MRFVVFLLVASMAVFMFAGSSFSEGVWELVSGIKEANLEEIAIDSYQRGIIYASSEKRLYRSEDNGSTWKAVFSAKGNVYVYS